jgi:hypothetical protein
MGSIGVGVRFRSVILVFPKLRLSRASRVALPCDFTPHESVSESITKSSTSEYNALGEGAHCRVRPWRRTPTRPLADTPIRFPLWGEAKREAPVRTDPYLTIPTAPRRAER